VLAFSTIVLGHRLTASRRGLLTVGLMTLALAAVPATLGGDPMGWPVHYFSILAGCLVALVLDHPRSFRVLRPLTKPSVATVVALGFVAAHRSVRATATYLDHHRLLARLPGFVAVVPVYALAVAILLPALIAPGPARWLLSSKPMVFLGERSYSIYLLQTIAQSAVVFVLPAATGLARAIPVAALAVLLAHGCYRWVELPMIGIGRGLIAHRRGNQHVSASAAHTITSP
jgi:peptidoglycan/LPS O-acetylase OafA/YrhL